LHRKFRNSLVNSQTSTVASMPICVVVTNYYNCGCRMSKLNICTFLGSQCAHSALGLVVSGVPHSCNSCPIASRYWNQRKPVPRGPACSAENPDIREFKREEDTASLLDQLQFDSLDGLRSEEALSQVFPSFFQGNWRTEVSSLCERFRANNSLSPQQVVRQTGHSWRRYTGRWTMEFARG
jgi:hypothetical protein